MSKVVSAWQHGKHQYAVCDDGRCFLLYMNPQSINWQWVEVDSIPLFPTTTPPNPEDAV
jgi:hypothetical protein